MELDTEDSRGTFGGMMSRRIWKVLACAKRMHRFGTSAEQITDQPLFTWDISWLKHCLYVCMLKMIWLSVAAYCDILECVIMCYWMTRLWNDLLCVEWDVKPYTFTHSLFANDNSWFIKNTVLLRCLMNYSCGMSTLKLNNKCFWYLLADLLSCLIVLKLKCLIFVVEKISCSFIQTYCCW